MLGFGHTGSMCLENKIRKARTFILGPFQDFLWHMHIVYGFVNLGFDQAILQQKCTFFFNLPPGMHEGCKDSYIPGFGVSIGGKE